MFACDQEKNSPSIFLQISVDKQLQVGSTEWVEENPAMLASRTISYLNVDTAVAGPGFYVSATPQLDELLKDASKQYIVWMKYIQQRKKYLNLSFNQNVQVA
jgi:hypothetical protein